MSGKCRPSLRRKTLENVKWCNLSQTDKNCIAEVFKAYENEIALKELCADVIRHQKEEIERLQTEKDNLIKTYKECMTEAVKEFVERLKAVSHPYADTQMVFELQIDNLVKEMVGEG